MGNCDSMCLERRRKKDNIDTKYSLAAINYAADNGTY